MPPPGAATLLARSYEAPQGALETAVALIWQDLLGLERVGRHDHFFELGGHSLMAVQLISRLRQSLGIDSAIRALFVAPTLAGFARAIGEARDGAGPGVLVPIRPHGRLRPLFLVHPSGGEVGYVRELAPLLDAEQPLYGLAARGFLGDEQPLASIGEMAALYVDAMRGVQARGPYRVGGYSSGGTIAVEMARQLLADGDSVEFLGLIDTYPNLGFGKAAVSEAATALGLVWEGAGADLRGVLSELAGRGDVDAMLEMAEIHALLPHQADRTGVRRQLRTINALENALFRHQSGALALPATLFAAQDQPHADPTRGWGALLGAQLRVVPLEGSHHSIVEQPAVRKLGAALAAALAELTLEQDA